jgi:hypothetical protein
MNNTDKYYNSFGLDRSIPRSYLKKQELFSITFEKYVTGPIKLLA